MNSSLSWLTDTFAGWFLDSAFGNAALAGGLIGLAFLILGRKLLSRQGLIVVGVLAVSVVGGGLLYRWLNAFDGPGFAFYEGNAASRSLLCHLPEAAGVVSLKNHPCQNDQIRSVKLLNLKKGTVLRVFDDPEGKLEDDWAEIVVLQDTQEHVVASFEGELADGVVSMHYSRNDGLDGKISRVEVVLGTDPSRPGGTSLGSTIAFYEGDNLTQNKVCELKITAPMQMDFKNSSECDNDEARSAVLRNVPAHLRIRLFDSPQGSRRDDWVDISILKPMSELKLSTFTSDVDLPTHRVQYHRNDGLQGKVSRLEILSGAPEPLAVFYEGNGGTQNIVCTVPLDRNVRARVGDFGCANDEARSVKLYNVPAARSIRLFDSPDFSTADDWTEIWVRGPTVTATVQSLERAESSPGWSVNTHRHNGLDGKVSAIEITGAPHEPVIDLHEGNNGSQNRVCSLPARTGERNFKSSGGCANDEVRSLVLHRVPVGTLIRVYDDPDGRRRDDWSEIEVTELRDLITVPSFQTPVESGPYRLRYFRNDGLDGKVSRWELAESGKASEILSFYEGANGSQNKICDIDARPGQQIRFGGGRACSNDEARSVVLTHVRAGLKLSVFDNPDCKTSDDWASIEVQRATATLVIRSFEQNLDDPAVKMTFKRKNGLNGKVSCIRIDG